MRGKKLYLLAVLGLIWAELTLDSHLNTVAVAYWPGQLGAASLAALSVYRIATTRYKPRELILFIISLIPFFTLGLKLSYTYWPFIILPLMVMASRGVNYRDILKVFLIGSVLGILVVVSCYLLGLIGTMEKTELNRILGIPVRRNSLGFLHVNNFGCWTLTAFLSYIYLRWKRLKIGEYLTWLLIALFLFFIMTSKTAAFLIVFGLLIHLMSMYTPPRFTLTFLIAAALTAAFCGIALPMIYSEDIAVLNAVNYLLTGRLGLAHIVTEANTLSLFGQKVDMAGSTVDNAYIYVLLNFGVVNFAVFGVFYLLTAKRAVKSGDIPLMMMIAICLLVGNTESWLYTRLPYLVLTALMALPGPRPRDKPS